MKKCPYCGLENPDSASICSTCHTELAGQPPAPAVFQPARWPLEYQMSPDEKRFWEKMTFRQFAILVIRIQSLWLFFYAVIDLTYLSRYFPQLGFGYLGTRFTLSATSTIELSMLVLRIGLYVASGIFLIQKTESVLGWLVKDCVKPASESGQT